MPAPVTLARYGALVCGRGIRLAPSNRSRAIGQIIAVGSLWVGVTPHRLAQVPARNNIIGGIGIVKLVFFSHRCRLSSVINAGSAVAAVRAAAFFGRIFGGWHPLQFLSNRDSSGSRERIRRQFWVLWWRLLPLAR